MDGVISKYVNGPFLKQDTILHRKYQLNIVNSCFDKNSLVVLPTGLGKTIIAVLLVSRYLKKYKNAKILLLAPTKPLIYQHYDSLYKFLDVEQKQIVTLTGRTPPEKRMMFFHNSRIIISTPQVIKNDLERDRYDLKEVSLIIFDEAHRSKKNYAYTFVSRKYFEDCSDPIVLGLTASPGRDQEQIQIICNNLLIENIVFKTRQDEDIKNYIQDIEEILEIVDLPLRMIEICEIWNHLFHKFLRFFIERGLINPSKNYHSKLDFLKITRDLTVCLQSDNSNLETLYFQSPTILEIVREKKLNIQSIFSYCASCISILHAKDLLETQDVSLFMSFLEKIASRAAQGVRSAERIANSEHFKLITCFHDEGKNENLEHPKLKKVVSIVQDEINLKRNKKVLIFTQYREMAELLKTKLKNEFADELVIEKFIGQQSKADGDVGYSQVKQIEIIKEFKEGKIDVLIATSVAEEGLDIPSVDSIIFYEPVPSEIRTIQRRGRTGRFNYGRCFILITENTVDVPFHKVAVRKENQMQDVLASPDKLKLIKSVPRKQISFSAKNKISEFEILNKYRAIKEKEKDLLTNRSIETIISELDEFKESQYLRQLKKFGITLYSEVIKLDRMSLAKKIQKMKCKNLKKETKQPKKYINNNIKTLINLVDIYSNKGSIEISKLEGLAEEEDLVEKKFYTHLNQACYLGFLQKEGNKIRFLKTFD
ncbi:MAG: DEAD/DEAH box helicase family protein [Candidatus Lokiarchaeota archaeon]|nr:DEAD/DEAH box helicase family protein [Candidatus Lokiarchaeota archaeon]